MGKKPLFPDEIMFLKKNFKSMTYDQLLEHINKNRPSNLQIKYSLLRHRLRDLGLKRYENIHWSKVQIAFLKKNYKIMGNKELAIILSSSRFRSNKQFTRKTVDKKMQLLGLKRTEEELKAIVQRNIEHGLTIVNPPGNAVVPGNPEGHITIVKCNGFKKRRIKINGKYIPYGRWNYIQKYGPIPSGYILRRRDLDHLNDDIENFELRKRAGICQEDYRLAASIVAGKLYFLKQLVKATKDEKLRGSYLRDIIHLENHLTYLKSKINGKRNRSRRLS